MRVFYHVRGIVVAKTNEYRETYDSSCDKYSEVKYTYSASIKSQTKQILVNKYANKRHR